MLLHRPTKSLVLTVFLAVSTSDASSTPWAVWYRAEQPSPASQAACIRLHWSSEPQAQLHDQSPICWGSPSLWTKIATQDCGRIADATLTVGAEGMPRGQHQTRPRTIERDLISAEEIVAQSPQAATMRVRREVGRSRIDTGLDLALTTVRTHIAGEIETGNIATGRDRPVAHTTEDGHAPHLQSGADALATSSPPRQGRPCRTNGPARLCHPRMTPSKAPKPSPKARARHRTSKSPTSSRPVYLPRKPTPLPAPRPY